MVIFRRTPSCLSENGIYDEVRENFSPFRFLCFLHIMSELRREEYTKMMETHTRKIARLLNKENDVDKYIGNRSSY